MKLFSVLIFFFFFFFFFLCLKHEYFDSFSSFIKFFSVLFIYSFSSQKWQFWYFARVGLGGLIIKDLLGRVNVFPRGINVTDRPDLSSQRVPHPPLSFKIIFSDTDTDTDPFNAVAFTMSLV